MAFEPFSLLQAEREGHGGRTFPGGGGGAGACSGRPGWGGRRDPGRAEGAFLPRAIPLLLYPGISVHMKRN